MLETVVVETVVAVVIKANCGNCGARMVELLLKRVCAHVDKAAVVQDIMLKEAVQHCTKQMSPIANSQLKGCNSRPNKKRAEAIHAIRLGKTLAGDERLGGGLLGGYEGIPAKRRSFALEVSAFTFRGCEHAQESTARLGHIGLHSARRV